MCEGLEMWKYIVYVGSGIVIREFSGIKWVEGIIVGDDGYKVKWKGRL